MRALETRGSPKFKVLAKDAGDSNRMAGSSAQSRPQHSAYEAWPQGSDLSTRRKRRQMNRASRPTEFTEIVRLWTDPSQQLLWEPRDDVKHPVDDLGDVVLHPGAHQESDLAARELVILFQPGHEARGR